MKSSFPGKKDRADVKGEFRRENRQAKAFHIEEKLLPLTPPTR